ncbi:MAG: DUF4234 domain-containing protein [Candidatus Nanohaloarchaeota archaeon QJJ-9]|nr:DUF4234 domain-containing protein [Candidatus Nanohaloarchaeota archaeon QJJ-9]
MAEKRSPLAAIVLSVITLGIYALYWFYSTSKELINEAGEDSSPALWLIGLFVPLVNFIVFWKYSKTYDKALGTDDSLVIFLLFVVIFPAAIYIVQDKINEELHS